MKEYKGALELHLFAVVDESPWMKWKPWIRVLQCSAKTTILCRSKKSLNIGSDRWICNSLIVQQIIFVPYQPQIKCAAHCAHSLPGIEKKMDRVALIGQLSA